jgi:hypothetical protein
MVKKKRNHLRRTKNVDQELIFCGPGTTYKNNLKGILVFLLSYPSINKHRFGE